MADIIFEQILSIRNSGKTNMFDKSMVQKLAFDQEYYELVVYLEDHTKEYIHFIMYGTER